MTRLWTRWTPEQIEKLKGLASDGLSSVDIARIMQMSRSKICGQLYRLGINLKVKATPPRGIKSAPRVAKPKHERKKVTSAVVEGMRDVLSLPGEPAPIGPIAMVPDTHDFCRWVHGDPRSKTWRYCGHKAEVGSQYCQHHRSRSYVKVVVPRNVLKMKATPRPWRSPI